MSAFEHELDVLDWYSNQKRRLTESFLSTIEWADVAKHKLDEKFLPVLVYMRDVEKFTEIYYENLRRTPTGRDPIIRRFMDKWHTEEDTHGELINRFLQEAGYPTTDKWYEEVRSRIPRMAHVKRRILPVITNCFGKRFSAVHMTWGAINEMSTLTGYQRLWTLAEHPVLTKILRGIASEEGAHVSFYWNVAQLQLARSGYSRQLAKFIISKFWSPVGSGLKDVSDSNMVIRTLFAGQEGLEIVKRQINNRVQLLPGLETVTAPLQRITVASQTPPRV